MPTSSIELRVGESVATDITPFVDRFVWTESMIDGGFSWDIKFKADQWREWDRIMFGRDDPSYQFRLRVDNEQQADSTEWRTAITDKSRAGFAQDVSMRGQIKGADRRLVMAQKARTRAWRNKRVSDIITQIAGEYGLDADVERSAATDINNQSRMSDWAFLRRMVSIATTESGRCDTYLWIDENTLRFGAPQVTDLSARRYDMSVVESRIEDYSAAYFGREADRRGAARMTGVGFDWYAKKGVVFTMGPGQAQSQPSLAPRVPRRMEDGLCSYPIINDTRATVEEEVRARWGSVAPRYLSLRVTTRPDLTVRPNSIISMESNLNESRETPFMGRYVILEVQHLYEQQSITTSMVCYRREAREGEAQPTGANADTAGTRDREESAPLGRTILVARTLG